MKKEKAVKEYQCPGCVCGSDPYGCYKNEHGDGIECTKHVVGTSVTGVGVFFLGMPTGFNKLGPNEKLKIKIFEKFTDVFDYDKFNVPVWKHLDKHGNTIVRGLMPRINFPFLHIILENCIDKVECIEITEKDCGVMD